MAFQQPGPAESDPEEPLFVVSADPAATDPGRHRFPKQRSVSRGSTVLGVAAIAAVGAGGVATAQSKSPVSIPVSVPDAPPEMVHAVTGPAASTPPAATRTASLDAGESLRTRILAQAQSQRAAADAAVLDTQRRAAEEKAAKEAAAQKVRDDAAKKKAEEEARRQAAADAAVKADAERAAQLATGYGKPVTSYTPTAGFGAASSLWASAHTGQDFAAPTGTPVMAIHSGTITSAGWAGSYGYRIVLTLDDGTELWYCHLSSMVKTGGQVSTGEVIGRVGATGNVTGPHLHLEVRPGGGWPVDPLPWLWDHGVSV
ncbi:M23 family metallopeptidase [Streptantibioticus ferralitis]|uniref:M23 family metallopeptidase n=1 Tax=Streptantibioticus ferralitis TaxID=236510 RepID=A0ABT5Z7Y5_9ACTN|nr:M23 family metallopeptidase [Streptantibioticus ferralitis]MDF2259949.1 M23 family metallopeptidase [Streptantibioticus ferralitis]